MNMSLPISEWHLMAMRGDAPPVRIQLNGYSMFPLVRKGMDFVTIIPPDRDLLPGDIVLFFEPDTGRYIVHRVWEIREGQVLTWGDHCEAPDRWSPLDMIWGRVILIEREGRNIHPNPKKGIRWAKFWHKARRAYERYERLRGGMNHIFEKLFR